MNTRQRGAVWLLSALVLGRALDALDLPFEHRSDAVPALRSTAAAPPPPVASAAESLRIASRPSSPARPTSHPVASRSTTAADTVAIHINRATADELQRLPGVGPVLAARIVADRAAHGPFRSAADLRRVRGIGAKTGARLAPRLRFD